MGDGPGTHTKSGSRSNAEIDPRLYQFLYELERRLDERFKEARTQNREDIANALVPVSNKLDIMQTRLAEGTERFDDHSERIENLEKRDTSNVTTARSNKSTALERKRGGWIAVDKIPALLQGLGILIATVFSSIALMRNPPQSQPTTPAQPAPANSPQTPP